MKMMFGVYDVKRQFPTDISIRYCTILHHFIEIYGFCENLRSGALKKCKPDKYHA